MQFLSKTLTKTLFIAVLVLLAATSTYFWFTNRQAQQAKISITTIVQELKEVSRLETAVFTTEQIIEAQKTENSVWKKFLFGDRILLIAHGQIVAGIDMSKITENSIRVEGKKVVITLPAAEIFSSTLDESKTRVYDRSTGLLNSGDINLESEARLQAAERLQDAACEAQILEQATKNAQRQMQALLKGLAFEDVVVITTPSSC